jgi:hypothetical protein
MRISRGVGAICVAGESWALSDFVEFGSGVFRLLLG